MKTNETARKIFHLISGLLAVLVLYRFPEKGWRFLFCTLLIGIALSWVCMTKKIPFIDDCLRVFDRTVDRKTFPGKGAIFFLGGILLAYALFSQDIAFASIAILTVGDSIANVIGRYGTHILRWNDKKTLEGLVAGTVTSTLCAALFVGIVPAFLASTVSMLAESVKSPINDNIMIPLVAGIVLSLVL